MLNIKKYLPFIILLAGLLFFFIFSALKSDPVATELKKEATTVTVLPLIKQTKHSYVFSTGTVESESEISLLAEVKGKIVYIAPALYSGKKFRKGDLLFRIDPEEYNLILETIKATYETQVVAYQKELEEVKIAKIQWEKYRSKYSENEPSSLTLREPQLNQAKANLRSAKASVETAQLNVDRTEIRVPFNCFVKLRSVDFGQYVQVGQKLITIFSTNNARIYLHFQEKYLSIVNSETEQAIITSPITGNKWSGKVAAIGTNLNSQNRMFQITVEVPNPYDLTFHKSELINGSFVNVSIKGKSFQNVYDIPRDFIRDNNIVYVENNGELNMRNVNIAHFNKNTAIVIDGIEPEDRLITSGLLNAAEGMRLKVEDLDEASN
jgi:RND family efflux transporter MFP subunit